MIILITGARKGIGKMLVQYFAKVPSNFVIGCSRGKSDFIAENYLHIEADVSKENEVKDLVKQIRRTKGKLDVLINNAGIASMNHSLLTPVTTVKDIFDVNFLGTFLLCRECSKLLKKSKGGRIVNFSTVAVPLKLEGNMVYAASKSAVETLTKIMSKELAEYKITVNTIGPSPVKTSLIRTIPKEKIEALLEQHTIKSFTTIDDIINIINFFISPNSDAITGQIIYTGGVS